MSLHSTYDSWKSTNPADAEPHGEWEECDNCHRLFEAENENWRYGAWGSISCICFICLQDGSWPPPREYEPLECDW